MNLCVYVYPILCFLHKDSQNKFKLAILEVKEGEYKLEFWGVPLTFLE